MAAGPQYPKVRSKWHPAAALDSMMRACHPSPPSLLVLLPALG